MMMKGFMLKSLSLISVMVFAVIFGMVVAKNNMIHMQGIHEQQPKQTLDFNINFPKNNQKQSVAKAMTLQEKANKLEKIQSFNPYAKMGDSFSNAVQSFFRKSINTTSQVLKQAVNAVIRT